MDDELVQRARNGEHEAFSTLIEERIGRLYGLAVLTVRDRATAEDAVQDALLKAWRDLPSLRAVDRFDAWLRRLVVNACYDIGRRRARRPEVPLVVEQGGSVQDAQEHLAQSDELERAFRRLTSEERSVIVLRYYLGLSGREAAASLGVGEVAMRSRLHRALRALAAALAADARPTELTRGRAS